MEISADYKKKFERGSKITSERQLILGEFLERLNADRKPPYPPLTPARLGMMMRFTSTAQMKQLYSELKQARSFAKLFWYKMKIK